MICPHGQSPATAERPDRTELGYRRFRCPMRPVNYRRTQHTSRPLKTTNSPMLTFSFEW